MAEAGETAGEEVTNAIKNATISTVPVEIKVVSVGGKKMTLAVFRQVQEEEFFVSETKKDSDGFTSEIILPPDDGSVALGYINYTLEKTAGKWFDIKQWLLWVTPEGELRRCPYRLRRYEGADTYYYLRDLLEGLPQLFIAV